MKRSVTAKVALVAVLCGGCGTVTNLGVPKTVFTAVCPPRLEVYGGVSNSVALCGIAIADHQGDGPNFTAAVFALDVALSSLGDTLTLPVTVPVTIFRAVDKAITDGVRDYYFPKEKPREGDTETASRERERPE